MKAMSKKHFVAAAKSIAKLASEGRTKEAWACLDLIIQLNDNPRFDFDRFRAACGLKDRSAK